ncbi:MAG: AAA-like domain-containing protein [Desulfobacterales bacterium]|nr:AAA-like domain-containing protein [Desulfobacterales bacterium]
MRKFNSYGPVDEKKDFTVHRQNLIKTCCDNLIGDIDGGHYFTIWAPRQTGKTWLMRRVKEEIELKYPDKFVIGTMSVQNLIIPKDANEDEFLKWVPDLIRNTFSIKVDAVNRWNEWSNFFHKTDGLFNRPVLLFIDEFDKLPPNIIDNMVTLFREMYLNRENYCLHGLALIGVRAVLGVESERGSPFNIQRSLHIPNFIRDEVIDLYQQYQNESGQKIDNEVVEKIFESTRGQPGLVCWFGELLTEKYNPETPKTIDINAWEDVFEAAVYKEWNNSVLNLIKKSKGKYQNYVIELFSTSNISFAIDSDWCSYLYFNGIIDEQINIDPSGKKNYVCRFSSPFVQRRLYNALTMDIIGERMPITTLNPLDDLSDVFENKDINVPSLLARYKDYLKRLKARGINPWKEQPRRTDLRLTEAVGHFHLYAWLLNALQRRCVISPEFPTGNGRVDLHLKCKDKKGIIEVKSFIDAYQVKESIAQAANYGKKTGLNEVTVAMFAPFDDETIIEKLSTQEIIDGIKVTVVTIGWT